MIKNKKADSIQEHSHNKNPDKSKGIKRKRDDKYNRSIEYRFGKHRRKNPWRNGDVLDFPCANEIPDGNSPNLERWQMHCSWMASLMD